MLSSVKNTFYWISEAESAGCCWKLSPLKKLLQTVVGFCFFFKPKRDYLWCSCRQCCPDIGGFYFEGDCDLWPPPVNNDVMFKSGGRVDPEFNHHGVKYSLAAAGSVFIKVNLSYLMIWSKGNQNLIGNIQPVRQVSWNFTCMILLTDKQTLCCLLLL